MQRVPGRVEQVQPPPAGRPAPMPASASETPGRAAAQLGGHPQRQRQPAHSARPAPRPPRARRPPARRSAPAAAPTASAGGSRSRSSRRAPSLATSPASASRLVTTATQAGVPGSSGRTCSASLALSSTTSIRRPASRLRYRGGALVASRPGCPARPRPARAGTRPARRPPAPAGRGHSRAGSHTAARRGTGPRPGGPSAPPARSCPPPAVPPIAEISTRPRAPARRPGQQPGQRRPARPPGPRTAAPGPAAPAAPARAGPAPARAAAPARLSAGSAGQDPLVQLSQPGSRLGAQLRDQDLAGAPVGGQRLGLAAVAVQGQHQLGVKRSRSGHGADQALELGDHAPRASPAAARRRSATPAACSRSSASRGTSRSASTSDSTSASGSPRHNASACRAWSAAASQEPPRAAARAFKQDLEPRHVKVAWIDPDQVAGRLGVIRVLVRVRPAPRAAASHNSERSPRLTAAAPSPHRVSAISAT